MTEAQVKEIDLLVFKAAGLRPHDQYLIEDFIKTNLLMIQGKVEADAVRKPEKSEMVDYLQALRNQLDTYMADDMELASHHLTVVNDDRTAMIEIVLREGKPAPLTIRSAAAGEVAELAKIRANLLKKHRQWIYFDRNLRIYTKGRLYLFKPLQRVQWTRRQAILDSDELIAEALGGRVD